MFQLRMLGMSVDTPLMRLCQFFPWYIIWHVTFTVGETAETRCESSRLTAWASPAVMVCPCPMPTDTASLLRRSGNTITRLLPIDDISLTIIVDAPLPIASTAMTAAMPTIMPRHVRSERVLLRAMARRATLNIIIRFMWSCRP